jgi:hypothetical protein
MRRTNAAAWVGLHMSGRVNNVAVMTGAQLQQWLGPTLWQIALDQQILNEHRQP